MLGGKFFGLAKLRLETSYSRHIRRVSCRSGGPPPGEELNGTPRTKDGLIEPHITCSVKLFPYRILPIPPLQRIIF